jgi:phenylpropionate dioxygenase-like ring-hydroxylating dioxygenase large terminal subunit
MTYVRNAWYVSAWAHDIVPERPVGVRLINEPIVIWRSAAGDLVAFEDRCVHRLAPLSLGRCEGERLRCRYHGHLYDRTGRVVEIPGQDRIPNSLRVSTYPVVERRGWVWVWMGDTATDEGLSPSAVGLDQPDYVFAHGQLDYTAEARLINENLLDLSHVSFLHAESFRMSETWARERPTVTEHVRCIRSERWFRNEGAMGSVDAERPVDTYFCCDFFVPGVLLMTVRTYPVGTADALNGQPPDLNQAPETFTSQAVTPLTDKTARYFYIMGHRRRGAETVCDMTITERAFAEDKTMIEAQQHNIDVTPGRRFVTTIADRGIVLFNRLVEKLAREESARLSKAAPSSRSEMNNSNSVV